MPVVINSFEAVADSQDQQAQKQDAGESDSNAKSVVLEPQNLTPVLHFIAVQALRSWAH